MGYFEKALKEKAALTPKTGYNLVGLDTFGSPEDQGLYLVDHYDEKADAEAELARRKEANPDITYYVYGPKE